MSLPEFFDDHLWGSVWIQEPVAQDLADHLIGAAKIGFGAGLLGHQGGHAALFEGVKELVIALAAETIFLSDRADLTYQTLAFQEHGEAAAGFIGGGNGEGPRWAGERVGNGIELEGCLHGGQSNRGGTGCLIKNGGRIMDV